MNAPIDPHAFRPDTQGQENDPHYFRSRFLEHFARIEGWASQRLKIAHPQSAVPPSVGQKLEAVRKLPTTHPALFRRPTTAHALLEELRPYHALRTTLAHSVTTVIQTAEGDPVFAMERARTDPAAPWTGRTAILASECRQILRRLAQISNELKQQQPADPKASAPPPPERA
jgi:DNA-binding transcriptional regulator YdaS (Cro superfamily)